MTKKKNIVVIGGGTGTFTVLTGLKKYPVNLTAIVSMTDDGGSNRVMRDEFGLLPTSDIRQCFVALAEHNGESGKLLRELFMYRFHEGKSMSGMTFGNLFLAALSDILGSQIEAIEKTSKILKIKGRVLPVTLDNSKLVALYEDGKKIIGEHLIDEPKHKKLPKIKRLSMKPPATAYKEAVDAILQADMVVLSPGDLYTSLVANLIVKGVAQALRKTRARKVYVLNLMTRYGQTYDFSAQDHIDVLEQYIGKDCLNVVVVNNRDIQKNIIRKYKNERSIPVADDLQASYFTILRRDLRSEKETGKIEGDIMHRSLIRHDSGKLARALMTLL